MYCAVDSRLLPESTSNRGALRQWVSHLDPATREWSKDKDDLGFCKLLRSRLFARLAEGELISINANRKYYTGTKKPGENGYTDSNSEDLSVLAQPMTEIVVEEGRTIESKD